MTKFEYRIEEAPPTTTVGHIIDNLNKSGEEGWEMVAIMPQVSSALYFFKREKVEEPAVAAKITEDQIKSMVNRFLGWRLPEDFNPDGGISFKRMYNDHLPEYQGKYEPVGTNLFNADQAEAMVRFMVNPDHINSMGYVKGERS